MMKRIFPALCAALLLAGCGAQASSESTAPVETATAESTPATPEAADATTLTFTDDLDREVTVPVQPQRVAVLLGSWLLGTAAGTNGYAASAQISAMWALFGEYWAAVFCLLGHMFPCMFHFKGGKGILSGGTIALMLDWRVALVVWGGFLILAVLTKWVSLGSIWAGASFPFATWFVYQDLFLLVLSIIIGGLIVWKHRGNLKRILSGTESKFSLHKKKEGTQ